MIESGIVYGILMKHKTKQPEDCLGSGLNSLDAESLFGIFLIFIIGLGMAIVLLIFEHLHRVIWNNKKKTNLLMMKLTT